MLRDLELERKRDEKLRLKQLAEEEKKKLKERSVQEVLDKINNKNVVPLPPISNGTLSQAMNLSENKVEMQPSLNDSSLRQPEESKNDSPSLSKIESSTKTEKKQPISREDQNSMRAKITALN